MVIFVVQVPATDAGYALSDDGGNGSSVTPIFGNPRSPKIIIGSRMILVIAPHN